MEGKIEGRTEGNGKTQRRCKQPLDDKDNDRIWQTERARTTSHRLENWLWNRLWTCRKTDYGMNERQRNHFS